MLNLTFEFYRSNFKIVLKSVIFLAGPPMIVGAAAIFASINFRSASSTYNPGSILLPLLITLAFFSVASTLAYGAVIEIVNLRALEPDGEITFEQVWKETRRDFFMIFFTWIGSSILIALGSILLIIPGVYLFVTLSMIQIVRVHEGLTFGEAISRCNELVKGNWWMTFGFLFVIWLVMYVLSAFVQFPLSMLMGAGTFLSPTSFSGGLGWLSIISVLVSSIMGLVVVSALVIAASLQYFNLAEKLDGTGLLERIDSIGVEDLPQEGDESTW